MREQWSKHKEKLWAPCEFILLLAALLSPILFSGGSSLGGGGFFPRIELSSEFLSYAFEEKPRSIASQVIQVPVSDNGARLPAQVVSVRQVRLELENSGSNVMSVERRLVGALQGDWESIPLVEDKASKNKISTYIELDDGENFFRIQYRGREGGSVNIPLVVNQIRKDRT